MAFKRPLWQASAVVLLTRPTCSFTVYPLQHRLQSSLNSQPETTKATSVDNKVIAAVYGGDYAGLLATYSASTGELIRVPDYMVPESLLDWGQKPACLEVLVSEAVLADGAQLSRQTVTVFPEVGCGVDNLETSKKEEKLEVKSVKAQPGFFAFDSVLPPMRNRPRYRAETTFQLRNEQRLRVIVDMIQTEEQVLEIQSPITMVMERKTSEESSGGTIADGGGLDGRTVSQLLGEGLNPDRSFAEEPTSVDGEEGDLKNLQLPASVKISFGSKDDESFVLNVCLGNDATVKRHYMKGHVIS